MASALDQLLSRRDAPDRYDTPAADLLPQQLEAATERLEEQIGQIPLLRNRADGAGITRIEKPSELVPLLFAHNTYKTYSEPWLVEGQWERMARWLATVTTYEVGEADLAGVTTIDEWIARMDAAGRFVAASSGTTGKPALLGALDADLEFGGKASVSGFSWATGIEPNRDRKFFGLGPQLNNARNARTRHALIEAFASPSEEPYQLPVATITTGSVMAMILLRRKIIDGVAEPSEVAEFERLSKERQADMEASHGDAIEALVNAHDKKLLLTGFFPHVYPLAVGVRERGYTTADYLPDNAMFTGGGLKGVDLPAGYREFIFGTFNLDERRLYNLYSMQELNTPFPRCGSGRFHVAPWVIALPLDAPGENLLDTGDGPVEGRAAFVDLSLSGRWGGVISGDRISIDFGRCACGREGPHIGPEIVRYADLESGDKLTCAGTIDAYVRGEV